MEWLAKDPDETRLYVIPWGEIAPDTIASFTLTRTSGTVTIGETDHDERSVSALISGGANGETATFEHTITTTAGQIIPKEISLRVTAGADSLSPNTSYTKGALGIRALGKLGIANYVFDTEAEEDVALLREMDDMMAEWQAKLEPLGYAQPLTAGTSLPSDASGIDQATVGAVVSSLAVRIAGDYGKTPAPNLIKTANSGRSIIFARYAKRVEMVPMAGTPTGAGHRYPMRRFFPTVA